MSKTKTALCVILICICSLCLFACGDDDDTGVVNAPPVNERESKFFAEWQNYLKDDVRILDAVIPGTHDSGTLNIGGNDVINFFSETQGEDIYGQLLNGSRYFDIRVNLGSVKNEEGKTVETNALKIFHSVINQGLSLADVLDDFNEFFDEYDGQFVVLDFQHFEDGVESRVREAIEEELDVEDYAIKTSADLATLTMGDIRESGARYIVLFGSTDVGENDYVFRRINHLRSPYITEYHTFGTEYLIKTGFPQYFAQADENKFFILQAQLTSSVNVENAVSGPIKTLEELNDVPMSEYVRGLGAVDNAALLSKINVIMRDYIEMNDEKQKATLSLNLAKNNIKAESIKFFTKMTEKAVLVV